ncbi:MAG: hypothetical protein LQ346_008332 [Caloplaca aetnensis]|nr:MAG: hypothetical protein LQ346_008332 [Caloplaca aetnensis]
MNQSSKAEMPSKEQQTDHNALPSEDLPAAQSTMQSSAEAEAQEILGDRNPGSSIFRGLGQLLHSVLLLGALDAKGRYLDDSTETDDAGDYIDTVGQSFNWTRIGGYKSNDAATETKGENEGTDTPEAADPAASESYEAVAADYLDSNDHLYIKTDGTPLPQGAVDEFDIKIDADGGVTEEMPVDSVNSADTQSTGLDPPEALSAPGLPRQPEDHEGDSSAQPLFQSFARPAIYPAATGVEDAPSVDYDELQPPTGDTNGSIGSPSSQSVCDLSEAEPEDEATSTKLESKSSKLTNTARKLLTGRYHRKISPWKVQTRGSPKPMNADDPPLQTVAAARKPIIVQSPVRQHSYKPMMSDGTESEDLFDGGERDEEDDFLAPFNRLERKASL